jgi:hypothetical protein
MGNVETYIYMLEGILHAGVEGLDLFLFGLGIHDSRHVSTDVEHCLSEVQVVLRDSATREYCRGCFPGLGTKGPSPDVVHHVPRVQMT